MLKLPNIGKPLSSFCYQITSKNVDNINTVMLEIDTGSKIYCFDIREIGDQTNMMNMLNYINQFMSCAQNNGSYKISIFAERLYIRFHKGLHKPWDKQYTGSLSIR